MIGAFRVRLASEEEDVLVLNRFRALSRASSNACDDEITAEFADDGRALAGVSREVWERFVNASSAL
jgi:hypothetical protein